VEALLVMFKSGATDLLRRDLVADVVSASSSASIQFVGDGGS